MSTKIALPVICCDSSATQVLVGLAYRKQLRLDAALPELTADLLQGSVRGLAYSTITEEHNPNLMHIRLHLDFS